MQVVDHLPPPTQRDRKAPAGTGRDAVPARGTQASPAPRYATRPPPTLPPGRALRPRGGNGEQGPGCGSANRRRGPFVPPVRSPQIQGIGLSPLRGTHGPRRQAGQYAGRRPPRDPRRRFLTRELARCSGDSRPCWIARSRNSASGTQLGRVPVGMCGWLRTRSAVASGSHHCRGPEQRKRCQSFRRIRVVATGR